MSNKFYFYLVLLFFFLIVFFISLNKTIVDGNKDKEEYKVYKENYPTIDYDENIEGCVIRKQQSMNRYYHGVFLIDLSNGGKFSLGGITRNYLYEVPDIVDFITINDSVYKPQKSDSIFVYRNGEVFYFILKKIINKKDTSN
ncbi:MAG: hypothetical protein ACLVKO_08130 [Dysgonomonas sp.]